MIKVMFYSSKPYVETMFGTDSAKSFGYEFAFNDFPISPTNATLAKGYDVVCVFVNDNMTEEVLTKLKEGGTKMIALRCAGFNNVDLTSAKKLGLAVARVPEYSPYAVAEHAMALLFTLNRKTNKAYNRVRDMNFSIDGLLGFDLNAKTMGVIGTGKIGQLFIKMAKGFGMNVIAYDVYQNTEASERLGFTYVTLDELYANADIIALHCPLFESNRHMINKESIAKMKKGVFIINTSRGGLYNAEDVLAGLKSGQIGAFGADVYEEEEGLFFEDFSHTSGIADDTLARLLSYQNALITAHQAFFTQEALNNITATTLNNIKDFFEKGEAPKPNRLPIEK